MQHLNLMFIVIGISTKVWDTNKLTNNFNVVRSGSAGVDSNAKVTLTVNKIYLRIYIIS